VSADSNESGTLDRQEFAALLQTAKVGLTDRQIRRLLAECDENEDGVIEYR